MILRRRKPYDSPTIFLPHEGHPGCGYTQLKGGQVTLHRLGLLPMRCKSCLEMLAPADDLAVPEGVRP